MKEFKNYIFTEKEFKKIEKPTDKFIRIYQEV